MFVFSLDPLSPVKRLKRLKTLEHLGLLVLLCISLLLFVFCCFLLNYRLISRGFMLNLKAYPQKLLQLGLEVSEVNKRPGLLTDCDLFDGEWVWDDNRPLYQSKDCRFLDDGFRCSENGRPDSFYTKWRWQPRHCNLSRFDSKIMLKKLRNRRLVFVGDSIGRNQWESLLCMLSQEISDPDSIYEINGNPITKHEGFLSFMFKDFNCTVEYYRAPFLVLQSRAPVGVPKEVKTTLKLDVLDWRSVQWKDADVLVFNTGHWWNYEKTVRGGCYFQIGNKVKMGMTVESAYRRAIKTLLDWIIKEVNTSKTQIVFRTYSPVHFRGGNWKTGGNCHLETKPDLGSLIVSSQVLEHLRILTESLSENFPPIKFPSLELLNVTTMTAKRKDGHLSLYYLGPNIGLAPLHRQDCSHWCLPGVPDTWNELLYVLFLRREAIRAQNLSLHLHL